MLRSKGKEGCKVKKAEAIIKPFKLLGADFREEFLLILGDLGPELKIRLFGCPEPLDLGTRKPFSR
jgi:hypothetical protein